MNPSPLRSSLSQFFRYSYYPHPNTASTNASASATQILPEVRWSGIPGKGALSRACLMVLRAGSFAEEIFRAARASSGEEYLVGAMVFN